MDKKSDKKRKFILQKAKEVFIRKGFNSVTIKDIVDECNISRGGIYLYFNSVDEIFMEVILTHNKKKLKETKDSVITDKSFEQLIDEYFEKQKNRLLNIDKSLLMALHEYRFSHKEDCYKEFFHEQFYNTKIIILELLNYGVKQGAISENRVDDLAMSIMFFIEGLSTFAVTTGVSEYIINSQINFMKNMVLNNKTVKGND
ncbi:MAG: TetR family transcriptional regulator [Clostridiales bacterium]|nr:MAG: TetR family transcriptional regulator [Clostridiales bacterium]